MAYSKIRQPKLSDVIEQQLEFLILEGTLRPGEKLPPERELAKQFDVSRPSLREAIQRLEAKGLLLRRQGGGTFVQNSLWQSFSDPLVELLSDHPESQFDLLETRHALEGIAAYYAALRSTDEDRVRIRELHQAMRSFEYQAHWLNLLSMLGEQLTVPEVKFVTHTLSTPAIPVDLILDVGNTHTCGVIIEDHGDANDGLR
ncbi:MAG: virulence factor SrfB, partial [Enterobacter sp.]|nr:virulence factor SrfB [Enterobacter sp.]